MIPYSTQKIEQDDIDGVVEVLKSGFLTQGQKVLEFEKTLCDYTGAKYAVTFNSATSALSGAYDAVGLMKNDEVITSPISFVATSNMFVNLGVKPIWCDVKLDGNIDVSKIKELITPKTKAIVPIHFAGKPVDLDSIHKIAKQYNLIVIEDAAHALGSSYKGKKIGSLSDMSVFSFHAIKPITTAEGGAVLTNNKVYAQKLRLFRSHGIVKKQLYHSDMQSMGYNYRLSEISAALGISQLKKLDSFIKTRDNIASYYDERFKNEASLSTIKIDKTLTSSRHLYPILLSPSLKKAKEVIFKELQNKNLGVQVHYKPIYSNSFYQDKFKKVSLFGAENFYNHEISIPCHQQMSMQDAKYVADSVLECLR